VYASKPRSGRTPRAGRSPRSSTSPGLPASPPSPAAQTCCRKFWQIGYRTVVSGLFQSSVFKFPTVQYENILFTTKTPNQYSCGQRLTGRHTSSAHRKTHLYTKQVIQDYDTVFDNSIPFRKNDPLRITYFRIPGVQKVQKNDPFSLFATRQNSRKPVGAIRREERPGMERARREKKSKVDTAALNALSNAKRGVVSRQEQVQVLCARPRRPRGAHGHLHAYAETSARGPPRGSGARHAGPHIERGPAPARAPVSPRYARAACAREMVCGAGPRMLPSL
jgi:hypothetical protein